MTKVTPAVLEQHLCEFKSTAQTEETQAKIKAIEHKIKSIKRGNSEKNQSLNRQVGTKHDQEEKKEKSVSGQSFGVRTFIPEKNEKSKAFLTKCMKKNEKKHEARRRARHAKEYVLSLEEKFAREPSQKLANQIESLNKQVTERENRSMNDSLHYLKSQNSRELNSYQVRKLERLEKTLLERGALEEHKTKEDKHKKVQPTEVPGKYKVKKLKNRLKRLQNHKEALKERYFKQPTAETKKEIEDSDAKTQAIQFALDSVLKKRAQFFGHSNNSQNRERKVRFCLNASELQELKEKDKNSA